MIKFCLVKWHLSILALASSLVLLGCGQDTHQSAPAESQANSRNLQEITLEIQRNFAAQQVTQQFRNDSQRFLTVPFDAQVQTTTTMMQPGNLPADLNTPGAHPIQVTVRFTDPAYPIEGRYVCTIDSNSGNYVIRQTSLMRP